MSGNLYTALIVDDDEDIRSSLREILEGYDFIIFEASGADDAFTITDRITPNIIILDVALGGMTGWTVLKLLRAGENTVKVPVLMISGSEDAAERFAVLAPKRASFLQKPFEMHEFLGKIAGFLGIESVTYKTERLLVAQGAGN